MNDKSGPAFPCRHEVWKEVTLQTKGGKPLIETVKEQVLAPGLTKREYFAGLAMQGLVSNKEHPEWWYPEEDSVYCVKLADALIAELEKGV